MRFGLYSNGAAVTSVRSRPSPEPEDRPAGAYHHGALRNALLQRAAQVIEERGLEALTLRGLARDLGVSHGAPHRHFPSKEALITALATSGFQQALDATLASMALADPDPWYQLNAMGRGYLRWAIENRTLFRVIMHPDVVRLADPELRRRVQATKQMVKDAVQAAQHAGRHPQEDLERLTLFTHAVPLGVAHLLTNPTFQTVSAPSDLETFVAQMIELIVPLSGRKPKAQP